MNKNIVFFIINVLSLSLLIINKCCDFLNLIILNWYLFITNWNMKLNIAFKFTNVLMICSSNLIINFKSYIVYIAFASWVIAINFLIVLFIEKFFFCWCVFMFFELWCFNNSILNVTSYRRKVNRFQLFLCHWQ